MPDDIDPEPMPVLTAPPSGTGFTYSTNGPASADTRQFSTPVGRFNLPANAQNPMFVQGPPPEDPETQMMRKFLSTIPVDQAEKAIHVAQQFQAKRAYQKRAASGVDPAQNLMQYFVESGATGGVKSSDISNLARAQEAFARSQPFTPRAVNVGGNQLVETGRGRFAFPPKVAPPVRWTTHVDPKTGRTIQTNPVTGEMKVLSEGTPVAPKEKKVEMVGGEPYAVKYDDEGNPIGLTPLMPPEPPPPPKPGLMDRILGRKPAATEPAATTGKPAPFKEGQVIRNKKTGKFYRIVGGHPLEIAQP